jgi:hypothetical protein
VSQNHNSRRALRPLKLLGADLPLAAHLALGGLVVLTFSATFMDLGVRELIGAAYFAAISYAFMNVCLGYLREHNPVAPRRVRLASVAGVVATAAVLTMAFRAVMGYSPLALTQTDLAVVTGVFILFFGAFVDTVTNPRTLRIARDPHQPYARIARWAPTWRAATVPMLLLLAVVHLASTAGMPPETVALALLVVAGAHVVSLVAVTGRSAPADRA